MIVVLVLLAPTVAVVVAAMLAAERETRIGPLSEAPGPGRRDRRRLAPVVELPARVDLVAARATPVRIRRAR